jgi:hypothetical protein
VKGVGREFVMKNVSREYKEKVESTQGACTAWSNKNTDSRRKAVEGVVVNLIDRIHASTGFRSFIINNWKTLFKISAR